MGGQTPLAKAFGWSGDLLKVSNFGFSYKFSIDALIGYLMPVFHINVLVDQLVANPQAYLEFASNNYLDIHLGLFTYRVNINFRGYRYTFMDYYYVQDIMNSNQWCSGMEWNAKALTAMVTTEEFVNECSYGLFGRLNDYSKICRSRRYTPVENVIKKQVMDKFDRYGEYRPYTCSTD
jgi:hypothetical protein